MKKLLILAAVVFMLGSGQASAQTTGEQIQDFSVKLSVLADSSLRVEESIEYVFPDTRHGIYRDIPYKYKARGGNFELRIEVLGVTDKAGQNIPFSSGKSGGYVKIKIGDPDKTVTGTVTYNISYLVRGAVNYFADHDELYWNVTGNEWIVPILSSGAEVELPEVADANVKTACYTGALGSQAVDCSVDKVARVDRGSSVRLFKTLGQLGPKEGLTIVVGWPKGIVKEPTAQEKLIGRIKDNGVVALPIVVLAAMFLLWRKYGKDPDLGTVVPQYEPPAEFSPAEVQFLRKGRVGFSALGPQLIALANLGHLKISKEKLDIPLGFDKEDYVLERIGTGGLQAEDEALLQAIFESNNRVSLYELKRSKERLFKLQYALQAYSKSSKVAGVYKSKTRGLGAFLTIIGAVGIIVGIYSIFGIGSLYAGLALGVSGIIIIIFASVMPARTEAGAKLLAHTLGFAEYIKVAEQDRIAFHDAPQKSPERFQKFLPFAMLLGLEKAWTKIFDGFVVKPDWYVDQTGTTFSALAFSDSLGKFSSSVQSFSTASSGGSGFSGGASGGGGGGGGGGSW